MGRISALTELTTLASDDYLVVLDSSANIAKKITIANAFGIPELGWTAAGESWTYSSWTSSTRIGVITVPTDATTKYVAGMRIKITQSTGGTKYGIIHKVEATALTVFFPTGTTLNNEAITSPNYTSVKAPIGFNANSTLWSLEFTDTAKRAQVNPTANTWYNQGTSLLVLGIGIWDTYYKASLETARGAAGGIDSVVSLSTSNSSATDASWNTWVYMNNTTNNVDFHFMRRLLSVTAQTTYYLVSKCTNASQTQLDYRGADATTVISATSAYL
jgi:hypothetical protein